MFLIIIFCDVKCSPQPVGKGMGERRKGGKGGLGGWSCGGGLMYVEERSNHTRDRIRK